MRRVIFIAAALTLISVKAEASCVSISSPASGTSILVGSSTTIKFSDSCTSRWFECLIIDAANYVCGTPNPQQFTWNTSGYVAGNHSVSVRSWTSGGGSLLGSASITVSLSTTAPLPSPTPAAGATPTPVSLSSSTPTPASTSTPAPSGHYSLMSPGVSLPSESAC